jgi:hypothetical protein
MNTSRVGVHAPSPHSPGAAGHSGPYSTSLSKRCRGVSHGRDRRRSRSSRMTRACASRRLNAPASQPQTNAPSARKASPSPVRMTASDEGNRKCLTLEDGMRRSRTHRRSAARSDPKLSIAIVIHFNGLVTNPQAGEPRGSQTVRELGGVLGGLSDSFSDGRGHTPNLAL